MTSCSLFNRSLQFRVIYWASHCERQYGVVGETGPGMRKEQPGCTQLSPLIRPAKFAQIVWMKPLFSYSSVLVFPWQDTLRPTDSCFDVVYYFTFAELRFRNHGFSGTPPDNWDDCEITVMNDNVLDIALKHLKTWQSRQTVSSTDEWTEKSGQILFECWIRNG